MLGLDDARRRMLDEDLPRAQVWDRRVLAAMEKVPRERFLPPEEQARAYDDRPLPIGFGQTISQPAVVGIMTQLLELEGYERVLEVGTGCGYQTAILCELAQEVCSIERIPQLSARAKRTLAELSYDNAHLKVGDGALGWRERAPFDRILLTAAPDEVPAALAAQLADGGRLLGPVGGAWQDLVEVWRDGDEFHTRRHGVVRFVPLVRGVQTQSDA